jgi:hypothetical protein
LESAPLGEARTSHKKPQKNQPQFDARTECYRVLGVDLTALPGVETPTALVLLCELGLGFAENLPPPNISPVGWDPLQQNARREEPRGHGAAVGRAESMARPKLFWRLIPPLESAPGQPQSRDGHGA